MVAVRENSLGALLDNAAPQSAQNRWPAPISVPHDGQAASCVVTGVSVRAPEAPAQSA